MNDGRVPALTFGSVRYGELQTRHDLRRFLYRGGAALDLKQADAALKQRKLGRPLKERLPLLRAFHREMEAALVAGGSVSSMLTRYQSLGVLFAWAEKKQRRVSLESIRELYVDFTEHLLHRVKLGKVKAKSIYYTAHTIGLLIDKALDRKSGATLAESRVKFPWDRRQVLGRARDKQNLADTFKFGSTLLDIARALTVEAITGPLPLLIKYRSGVRQEMWGRLRPPEKVRYLALSRGHARRLIEKRRAEISSDGSLASRRAFVNLRIEAELLIFIAQTGMNLGQAMGLTRGKFSYQSHLNGYLVRRLYKNRKKGEVEFEIYSAYREHFERYLAWSQEMLPDDDTGRMFPFVIVMGASDAHKAAFVLVRKKCRELGIPFIGPNRLRATRVNWLLRKSQDPALTAEMAQHTQETLIRDYLQPNHQLAAIEISRFLSENDPMVSPPGPGACVDATPLPFAAIPANAPQPDCVSPAGCLFCVHHRDIDSIDHVWSLCSYRYLKSHEVARLRPSKADDWREHPALAVMQRIDDKLKFFESSNSVRRHWVRDAQARVSEGEYHPNWHGFIALAELT
jgi:hypothetical protein